jgi:hypothetical protein
MTLHTIPLNFLRYEENFIFFLSVHYKNCLIEHQNSQDFSTFSHFLSMIKQLHISDYKGN